VNFHITQSHSTDMKQKINCHGNTFKEINVSSGVSPGFVLEPLLFRMLNNEMLHKLQVTSYNSLCYMTRD
jgi:hypothetical protein